MASGIDPVGAMAILNVGSFKTYSRVVTSYDTQTGTIRFENTDTWMEKHHAYFLEGKFELNASEINERATCKFRQKLSIWIHLFFYSTSLASGISTQWPRVSISCPNQDKIRMTSAFAAKCDPTAHSV